MTYTMGKKSREKRAKQVKRDKKRDEAAARVVDPTEQEEVPSDNNNTPAADAKPSTDDTHDEPASTIVRPSDSTAAVGEELRAFCKSCAQRLVDDIDTWVDGADFSGDIDAAKAAAERGDAKAQYALGFLTTFLDIPGFEDDAGGAIWLRKATEQGCPPAFLSVGVRRVDMIVCSNYMRGKVKRKRRLTKRKDCLGRQPSIINSPTPSTS